MKKKVKLLFTNSILFFLIFLMIQSCTNDSEEINKEDVLCEEKFNQKLNKVINDEFETPIDVYETALEIKNSCVCNEKTKIVQVKKYSGKIDTMCRLDYYINYYPDKEVTEKYKQSYEYLTSALRATSEDGVLIQNYKKESEILNERIVFGTDTKNNDFKTDIWSYLQITNEKVYLLRRLLQLLRLNYDDITLEKGFKDEAEKIIKKIKNDLDDIDFSNKTTEYEIKSYACRVTPKLNYFEIDFGGDCMEILLKKLEVIKGIIWYETQIDDFTKRMISKNYTQSNLNDIEYIKLRASFLIDYLKKEQNKELYENIKDKIKDAKSVFN